MSMDVSMSLIEVLEDVSFSLFLIPNSLYEDWHMLDAMKKYIYKQYINGAL